MAEIRVWNPHDARNPRKKKVLSPEQVEERQAKAVRFLRNVKDDSDLADEIEDLSVREYAERKGFELSDNPTRKRKDASMKKEDLQQLQETLKNGLTEGFSEVKNLVKQVRRSNPNGQQQVTPTSSAPKLDQATILDRVDDAAAALADGDEDGALDILNGLLDDYDD